MSKMSHINVIEKYEEYRSAIYHLLSSILSCFADAKMFEQSQQELTDQLDSLCNYYPFISLLLSSGCQRLTEQGRSYAGE